MVREKSAAYLSPLQLGVACPAGAETIVHGLNSLARIRGDDHTIALLKIDFQNAFNSVDRSSLLRQVQTFAPELFPWVAYCYSSPSSTTTPRSFPVRLVSNRVTRLAHYSSLSFSTTASDYPRSRTVCQLVVPGRRRALWLLLYTSASTQHSFVCGPFSWSPSQPFEMRTMVAVSASNFPDCSLPPSLGFLLRNAKNQRSLKILLRLLQTHFQFSDADLQEALGLKLCTPPRDDEEGYTTDATEERNPPSARTPFLR